MTPILFNTYRSVQGFNKRVRFLILHYTALDFAGSVKALTGSGQVSAHYLAPDPCDPSYLQAGFKQMNLFNLVDENDRAWHAGASAWDGRSNLNDSSIGVEIVNLAREEKSGMVFPPYHPQQVEAVTELARNILARYPDISPVNVLGHSDIAVGRKSDPGPMFPWRELHQAGVGAWPEAETQRKYTEQFQQQGLPGREKMLEAFKHYGYEVTAAGGDAGFSALVRAFQMHFRAGDYSGALDVETEAILFALLERYWPKRLALIKL